MKFSLTIVLAGLLAWNSSSASDLCVIDDSGQTVGCSLMVRTGSPMEPMLVFLAKPDNGTTVWELGVRVLLDDWVDFNGDAEILIDGADRHELKFILSRRAEVTRTQLSESASYATDEGIIRAIADAAEQVRFEFRTADSEAVVLQLDAASLSGLNSLLAEVQDKL